MKSVHMGVVGVCRVEHSMTNLAGVGQGLPKVLRLDVVLQSGEPGAGLLQPAHSALVASLTQFLYILPDQRTGILCNRGGVRFGRRCSCDVLKCARFDCFWIENVCHRTGKRKWTGCRGARLLCDPPSRSSTRTASSICDIATRLPCCDRHHPLDS